MKSKLAALALASLLLSGCFNGKELLQKITPKEEDALARHFVESVRIGDYGTARSMLVIQLQSEEAIKALQLCHGLLDHGEPLEIEMVDCNITADFPSRRPLRTDLSYQFRFRDSWVLADVILARTKLGTEVAGFHFYPMRDSLANINRFTLKGKSLAHFAVLTLCILIPAFVIWALVVCIRSSLRRKWLWIIFILFGIVSFHFNWTTGYSDMQPISLTLFSFGIFSSGLYGPWILHWSLPVGAFVFFMRRRKLIKPPVREMPNQLQSE